MSPSLHFAGCPVGLNKLKPKRVTHSINIESVEIQDCEYDKKTSQHRYFNPLDTGARWAGWTEFERKGDAVDLGDNTEGEMAHRHQHTGTQ